VSEARSLKFVTLLKYGKFQPMHENKPQRGCGLGHVTLFSNYFSPLPYLGCGVWGYGSQIWNICLIIASSNQQWVTKKWCVRW